MKKAIFINSLIMTVTSVLFHTVGISFRVYLSNKIGAEGIGLFQLVLSIYMMAVIFSVSGVNIAVTRLVAEEGGRRSYSVSRAILKKAFLLSLIFSIPAFIVMFFGAGCIGTVLLNDERAVLSLKILAAGLPFMGFSSCIKGYFYAVGKVVRPVAAQAIEIAVQVFLTVTILRTFFFLGLEYACAAIVLGTMLSELTSCFFLLILYQFEMVRKGKEYQDFYCGQRLLYKLLAISFPVSASSLLRSGLKALENIMIPMGFGEYGYTRQLSLEKYGMIQGMVIPILLFPSAVFISFSTLLIPEVSEANALNHQKRVHYSVGRSLQLTFMMSILMTGLFYLFSGELGFAIYDNAETGILMKLLSFLIPFLYVDIVVDALLKGLDQQVAVLKYNLIEAALRVVLIYYLIPLKGEAGFVFVLYTSNILNTILSLNKLLKIVRIELKVADWILKPALSVTSSGLFVLYLFSKINMGIFPAAVNAVAGIFLVSILYVCFLIRLDCLSKEDLRWLKSIFLHINTG